MKLSAIREAFFTYFREHQHEILPSSSLVPGNDPTLLFTNAGMVPFKNLFLGLEERRYTRAATSQVCVRAGGKHNDLDNVGYTARHHTLFEMLGNFSFGDYFKREAIDFAWNFLTKVLKLPTDRLWVTVYKDDKETADIWLKELKVDPNRFSYCGEADNFWSMGDTGPCGPCTEIFYDHGPSIEGGPPGSSEQDGDRYVEIWNLVFMQYERQANGDMTPLPKPCVDTGMGIERIAAVMQGVHDNYHIDLFQHLIKSLMALGQITDGEQKGLRVIADHVRSAAFLIADGVFPGNEGRGYVLRRIIRRALRYGDQLGFVEPFFYQLVAPLVEIMGEAYPKLLKAQSTIEKVLRLEEEQFARTLNQGLKKFESLVKDLAGKEIAGDDVFRLYDTYGFPADLTADIARERGLTIDEAGFHAAMAAQREQSQAASEFNQAYERPSDVKGKTEFTGYERLEHNASIRGLFNQAGKEQTELVEGELGTVILASSPFYAEGGGQVGDEGELRNKTSHFIVESTQKQGAIHHHCGKVTKGVLRVGDEVDAYVNKEHRRQTAYNHSATHLLHAALRHIVGEHVTQKGSLVTSDRLRFDFSHFEALTPEQIVALEHWVNHAIRANAVVETHLLTPEEAIEHGAMALFGEKYGELVRVLTMGDFSCEICGGTHVKRTGDIGVFKITTEFGIAAGIRRIEALTGDAALAWFHTNQEQLHDMSRALKCKPDQLPEKFHQLVAQQKILEKQVQQLQGQLAAARGSDLMEQVHTVDGVSVLVAHLPQYTAKALRDTVDQVKNKLGSGVVVLASTEADKIILIAGVTSDLLDRYHAGQLVNYLAQQVDGKGGGRADMAQAGGNKPTQLPAALASVEQWIATGGKK
ncbi:MAG: alanine--tRNA ligase [Gammaproteobacteria bacterium]